MLRSRAALVAIAEDRLPEAEKLEEEAQVAYEQAGDKDGQMRARATLGWVRELQGNYTLALTDYEVALDYFESRRQSTTVPELQMLMAGQSADVYDRVVRTALHLQKTSRAFLLTERSRARSLLDRLAALHIDLPLEAPPEARRQQQLSEDIRSLDGRIATEKSDQGKATLRQERDEKEREYYRLVNAPALAVYSRRFLGQPRPAEQIQPLLDEQTTLVSYFVTPEDTFAFILTRTSVEYFSLGVGRDELTQVIRASHDSPHGQAWAQLSAWLLGPIRGKVKTPRLGLIPHGALHAVSFAFLPVGGDRRLIDDHTVFYLPSASSLVLLPANHPFTKPKFLAVSQPQGEDIRADQRFSDLTIDRISAQFEGTLLKDDTATESMVRQQAPRANIVYISAHARADGTFPALSAIHLRKDAGSDGKLTVEEIYGLTLKGTNLVVLSACETGAGNIQAGDELTSLNRAFHAAGAPTVVSTLRLVNANVSSVLMEKFFAHLREGKDKAEALALAQRSIARTQPKGADWAAFILTGRP
jgi:CHAT domain-containing protein